MSKQMLFAWLEITDEEMLQGRIKDLPELVDRALQGLGIGLGLEALFVSEKSQGRLIVQQLNKLSLSFDAVAEDDQLSCMIIRLADRRNDLKN